ncbi:MAG: hypothetical protein JHC41_01705 [Nitrosopumilus sp.]|nr:hypothetical protein [Nitrosopumilus sp.]
MSLSCTAARRDCGEAAIALWDVINTTIPVVITAPSTIISIVLFIALQKILLYL